MFYGSVSNNNNNDNNNNSNGFAGAQNLSIIALIELSKRSAEQRRRVNTKCTK